MFLIAGQACRAWIGQTIARALCLARKVRERNALRPANQAAWTHDGVNGFTAYKIADSVQTHEGWGLGSYGFFNVNPTIHAAHAFEVLNVPAVMLHDLLTVSLGGFGVIHHVVNDIGAATQGKSTIPVNLVSYP